MQNLSISNSCVNCKNMNEQNKCSLHEILVNEKYTCDGFSLNEN